MLLRTGLGLSMAALALPALALAQGQVWIVGPGGQFADIQPAVAAAGEGDTLLVKPGTYSAFTIENKGLRIVADGSVQVQGQVAVLELEAGKLVALAGLKVNATSTAAHALRSHANAGALRIQGCTFEGKDATVWFENGGGAALITSDADTVLVACTLTGGDGVSTASMGGPGKGATALFARAAGLSLYGCVVSGGAGGSNGDEGYDGGDGGHGLETPLGTTFASGCQLLGGRGGDGGEEDGYPPYMGNWAGDGGDGGHGVFLGSSPPGSADPQLHWQSCSMQGGAGGNGGAGYWGPSGLPGAPGQPIYIANGTEVPLPGPARFLSGAWLVREGQTALIQFAGAPGDLAYLRVEAPPHWPPVGPPPFTGPVLRSPLFCGVIPAGGKLTFPLPAGALPPGVDVRTRILRPIFVDPLGAQEIADPFALTVLDQQF